MGNCTAVKTHEKALYGLTWKDHRDTLLSEEQEAEKYLCCPLCKKRRRKNDYVGLHVHKNSMNTLLRNYLRVVTHCGNWTNIGMKSGEDCFRIPAVWPLGMYSISKS